MALPSGITTRSYTVGTPFDWQGNRGTQNLLVKPLFGGTAARIVWAATGDPFEAPEIQTPLSPADGTSSVTFALPVVDQAGWIDGSGNAITDWSYSVKITPTVNGKKLSSYTKIVSPKTTDPATQDLDKMPDGSAAAPTIVERIASIAGLTGEIEAADLVTAILDELSQHFARVVDHGSTKTTTRPDAEVVIWKGSVTPNNLDPNYDLAVGPDA